MRRCLLSFAALSVLVSTGCKDREITSYRAPKDPLPSLPASAGTALPPAGPVMEGSAPMSTNTPGQTMANTAVPTGSDALTWTAPDHWTTMPQRPMRKASFAVKGDTGADADLSITSFPGSTGGLLANIRRWRDQLAMPAISDADLQASLVHMDSGPFHFDIVDMAGTAGGASTRIVGAVLPHGDETWFFKLMGPDALVAREKAAFVAFLKTVRSR